MDRPVVDSALALVRAYYVKHSALQRGLAERQTPSDFGARFPPRAAESLWCRAAEDIHRLRCIDGRLQDELPADLRSLPPERVFSDAEIIRHAQRIMAAWWREELAAAGEPAKLIDLLRFDGDYLFLGAFVEKLLDCRAGGTRGIRTDQRRDLTDGLLDVFKAAPGAPSHGPSPTEIKRLYLRILGELRSSTPTTRDRSKVQFRDAPILPVRIGTIVQEETGFSSWAEAERHALKKLVILPRISRVGPNGEDQASKQELSGLEKVMSLLFPLVPMSRDRRGRLFPDPRPDSERTSNPSPADWRTVHEWYREAVPESADPPAYSLEQRYLRAGIQPHLAAPDVHRLIDGWADIIGNLVGTDPESPRQRPASVAHSLLACRYGLSEGTVRRYVQAEQDLSPVPHSSIIELDPRRDWTLADRWVRLLENNDGVVLLCGTARSRACGLSDSELSTIALAAEASRSTE